MKQELREEHDYKFEKLNEKRLQTLEKKIKADERIDEIGWEAYPAHL